MGLLVAAVVALDENEVVIQELRVFESLQQDADRPVRDAVLRFIACADSAMLGTGRTIGTHVLVVMPCREGVTPRNIEVWHGNVADGTTLCALNVYAPRAIRESMLGVTAC